VGNRGADLIRAFSVAVVSILSTHVQSNLKGDQDQAPASSLMTFFVRAIRRQSEVRLGQATRPRKATRPPEFRTQKRRGELAELAFVYKAASLGFGAAKPYGDSERFDFIVSSGHHLWRVQVKSTYSATNPGYRIHAHGNEASGPDLYTKDDIDMIVAYVFPVDAWYVIPIEAIKGRRSLYFYPNGSQRGLAMYEKYREAWWLMKSDHAASIAKRSEIGAGPGK
jgi:hypothetical protein